MNCSLSSPQTTDPRNDRVWLQNLHRLPRLPFLYRHPSEKKNE
jgi:hypothetical protein